MTAPPDAPDQPTPRRHGNDRRRPLFVVLGWAVNIGAIALLFGAWQLWGTALVQHHEQQQLARQFRALVTANTAAVGHASVGLLPRTGVAGPSEGSVTAHLQIPAIGLDQLVVEGTSTTDLAKGPGHYTGTAVAGQAGNVAIAGHRTTFGAPFGRLAELRAGEPVTLTTSMGARLSYVVARAPFVVSPADRAILDDFGDNRLTLSTSTPTYSATQRLVVVALLDNGAAATQPVGGPPGRLTHTKTAGWNGNQLPLAGAIALGLVLLGSVYRSAARRLRRVGTVIVFIPLWAAGIYFLFQAFTNVLPSTL